MKIITTVLLLGSLLAAGALSAQQTETRKVPDFIKLDIGGSFDAVLRHGNETSVKIITENIDPKKILTETSGNRLKVSLEKGFYHDIKIKLEITYKDLDVLNKSGSGNLACESDLGGAGDIDLSLSGSGNMTINGTVKGTNISILRSGSGNMKLARLQSDRSNMVFSGSGNFEVADGAAKTQTIHLSGSGNVSAYGLKTETCAAVVSGSGEIKVSVSNSIEATITGSGNIEYRGNAQVTKLAVHGSGRISKKS
ncbi:MAG: head GIN domain-containing protein [Niastella sp.]|uniref:head GIN domain-containing protein n=1 Tax=Niastella sp. TaxID=1869183 RepID=UPI00389A56A8